MTRDLVKHMIGLNQKLVWSHGEALFNEYQLSRKMELLHDVSINFYDIKAIKFFTFQCDFVHLNEQISDSGLARVLLRRYDSDYEIDGKGHKSANDKWKDSLKNTDGLKVIHIPEELTKPKWWDDLDELIDKAQKSKVMTHYLDQYA